MPATYVVTRAKNGGNKPNPHGGELTRWYVGLKNDTEEHPDVYWQRKSGSKVNVGDQVYGTVTNGDYGPRFKMEQRPNGASASSSGSTNPISGPAGPGPEFWAAKDRRIARAGMLQAVVTASKIPGDPANLGAYVADVNLVTDALIASLDERVPPPNEGADVGGGSSSPPKRAAEGSPTQPQPAVDVSRGFASSKQKDYFESLLKQTQATEETRGIIVLYAESMPTAQVSAQIDLLKDAGSRLPTAKRLAREAKEWADNQPASGWPDERDLPEAQGTPVTDETDIPF